MTYYTLNLFFINNAVPSNDDRFQSYFLKLSDKLTNKREF